MVARKILGMVGKVSGVCHACFECIAVRENQLSSRLG